MKSTRLVAAVSRTCGFESLGRNFAPSSLFYRPHAESVASSRSTVFEQSGCIALCCFRRCWVDAFPRSRGVGWVQSLCWTLQSGARFLPGMVCVGPMARGCSVSVRYRRWVLRWNCRGRVGDGFERHTLELGCVQRHSASAPRFASRALSRYTDGGRSAVLQLTNQTMRRRALRGQRAPSCVGACLRHKKESRDTAAMTTCPAFGR